MSRIRGENLRKGYILIFREIAFCILLVIALCKFAHRKLETMINLENHYVQIVASDLVS